MAEKKRYTFTSLFKGNKEGTAVGYLEGWVSGEMRDNEEKQVINFGIATHNTQNELSYTLGTEIPADNGTIFVRISAWEKVRERLLKAGVTKGCLVGFGGVLKTEEYDGKKRVVFTPNNFKVIHYADNKDGNVAPQKEAVTSGAPAPAKDDLPF